MSRKLLIIAYIVLVAMAALACFCYSDVYGTVGCKNGTANHKGENCGSCGKNSCDRSCSSATDTTMKSEKDTTLSCKLTAPELQKRKATAIADLKNRQKEQKELENGFAYRFEGTDETIDLLAEFVKSERQCCDFFNFTIRIENESAIWLDITGPEGIKDLVKSELEM